MSAFLAIDFETASYSRTSACAVGLVLVNGRRIVFEDAFLIRPPTPHFHFTDIHGLTWEDVRHAPTFGDLWPKIGGLVERADFLAAHNASFDQGVLGRCCEIYSIAVPEKTFTCTVKLARTQWGIYPTKLPDVCRELGIPLKHHDAASDARACAEIVITAEREGWQP